MPRIFSVLIVLSLITGALPAQEPAAPGAAADAKPPPMVVVEKTVYVPYSSSRTYLKKRTGASFCPTRNF